MKSIKKLAIIVNQMDQAERQSVLEVENNAEVLALNAKPE